LIFKLNGVGSSKFQCSDGMSDIDCIPKTSVRIDYDWEFDGIPNRRSVLDNFR